jgi:phosphate-selective porin OprO/OprP
MNLKRLLVGTVICGSLAASPGVRADDTTDAINELKRQIQELNKKVEALEQKQAQEKEAEESKAKETPRIVAGAEGFSFRSADTNFVLALHGHLQADSRTFLADHGLPGNDSFLLRRARPILQGTLFRDFDFLFVPDFAGNNVQILDAFMNYRYRPELQLQAGKFKPPVGLEALQADIYTLFNERSLATDLVPYRDIGAELRGDIAGGVVSYAAGIFNGVPDYTTTTTNAAFDDNKAFEGRLFFQPFKQTSLSSLQGLGFGVGGSYEVDRAKTNNTELTAGFNTDGQQRFFSYTNGVFANGTHWRLSPQGYYYYGPLGIMGEYVISDQEVSKRAAKADLQNKAWEVTGSWVLTGEDASYSGVTPRHPFDPRSGHWGAFQVVGRYAQLDVDDKAFPTFADPSTSASEADAWAAGLNWYLNRNIRVNASFSRTSFGGKINPSKATVTRQPENVIFTRVQLAF